MRLSHAAIAESSSSLAAQNPKCTGHAQPVFLFLEVTQKFDHWGPEVSPSPEPHACHNRPSVTKKRHAQQIAAGRRHRAGDTMPQ